MTKPQLYEIHIRKHVKKKNQTYRRIDRNTKKRNETTIEQGIGMNREMESLKSKESVKLERERERERERTVL